MSDTAVPTGAGRSDLVYSAVSGGVAELVNAPALQTGFLTRNAGSSPAPTALGELLHPEGLLKGIDLALPQCHVHERVPARNRAPKQGPCTSTALRRFSCAPRAEAARRAAPRSRLRRGRWRGAGAPPRS